MLVFIVACLDRQFQTDFWTHLARGGEIVGNGNFITADHFAVAAAGATVRDGNWLSQVFFYRLFSWGGLLVQFVNALTLSGRPLAARASLSPRGARRGAFAAFAGVITFLVAWQTFLIRPQTFSILLIVLLYSILSHPRRGTLLIWPPLILLLWVNLHGGFLIGLVLIAVFALASLFEIAPSPGTPGEGRGEGDFEHQQSATFQITLSRDTGRGSDARLLIASFLLTALATLINPWLADLSNMLFR